MTSQEKPVETLEGVTCPFCGKGTFSLCRTDFKDRFDPTRTLVVKGVWVERCGNCGEVVYPSETSRYIEAVLDETSRQGFN